jgi:hypothetical protein
MRRLGCAVERGTKDLYIVDVLPEASLDDVWQFSLKLEHDGVLEFEAGHV